MAKKKDAAEASKMVVLAVRLTEEEREIVHAAATRAGGRQNMTAWVKETLLEAAKKVK